jgi:hypothetical protein
LPSLSPARSLGLIEKLEKDPKSFLASLDGVNPLARCNALVTYLERHKPKEESQIISLLIEIARSFDYIDYSNLLTVINEDRQIAKIPLIPDVDSIKQEMQDRRGYMIGVMKNCLNLVEAPEKVFTEIVTKTTSDGKQHPPVLIEELTDKYQIEVQKYLDQLVGQIRNIIASIQEQPKKTFEYQMPTLCKYLKTWDQIAQPIQLIQQTKGIDDPNSKELAQDLRDLAINMANSYEMHSEAKQVTKIVAEIFKELPQFAEKVSEDLTVLENILKGKAKSEEEEQKWREECSLDVTFGTIFKKRLIITREIIRFKNDQIPTSEVNKVRWGAVATKHSVNFIPTGTTYSYLLWIGSNQKSLHIEPSNESLYNMIIDRLWKAVCVRMMSDTLRQLSEGANITFGNDAAIVNKNGITLKKRKLFGRSEPVFYKWEDLSISNGNGTFIVKSRADKSIGAELSYRDVDNVHILEAILRFLWKDGNYQKLRRGDFSESSELEKEKNIDALDDGDDAQDDDPDVEQLKKYYYDNFLASSVFLKIDDVYHLEKRGTVVTGKLLKGVLKIGDQVNILGYSEAPRKAIIKGIEMQKKLLDSAMEGAVIGILLGGENTTNVKQGNILVKQEVEQDHSEANEGETNENSENNLIKVRCPACKEVMTVSLHFTPRGNTIACSNCTRKFTLPR